MNTGDQQGLMNMGGQLAKRMERQTALGVSGAKEKQNGKEQKASIRKHAEDKHLQKH